MTWVFIVAGLDVTPCQTNQLSYSLREAKELVVTSS